MIGVIELVVGIVAILAMSMIFCNALEHLGESLGLSEGVTGSLFVAIGTALPETIVPIIALLGGNSSHNAEIGIGAIMGPPLMLSTLSVALMAFSVLAKRGINGVIMPEKTGFNRDLLFFMYGYGAAIILAVSHNYIVIPLLNYLVMLSLFLGYVAYVLVTIRASTHLVNDGHATEAEEPLLVSKYFKLPTNLLTIFLQSILGLIGLIYFAHVFINGINETAKLFGISSFLLSLVLIPIATELPEKVNSILWIRKSKDTLAIANISGAMVFQGLLLPIMGIALTDWRLSWGQSISCITTFVAVIWLHVMFKKSASLKVKYFIFNGALYFSSLVISYWIML